MEGSTLSFRPAPLIAGSDSEEDVEFEEVQNAELDSNAPTKRKAVEAGEGEGIEIVLEAGTLPGTKVKGKSK